MKVEFTQEEYWVLRENLSKTTRKVPDPISDGRSYSEYRVLKGIELKLHREAGKHARNQILNG